VENPTTRPSSLMSWSLAVPPLPASRPLKIINARRVSQRLHSASIPNNIITSFNRQASLSRLCQGTPRWVIHVPPCHPTLSLNNCSFVGGEVDKLAETKGVFQPLPFQCQMANTYEGMNAYDRERAQHQAKESSQNMYDQHYEQGQGADQYNPNQYGPPQQLRGGNY